MYCGFVEKYGPLDRVDLLGVAPLTWSNDWSFSYTTLRFRRDTLTVTWEWRVDRLVRAMSSCDVPEPQSLPLGPLAPGRYLSYDWFSDGVVPIALLGKDRLRVGDLEARRIDEGRRVRDRRDCR